MIVLRSKFWFRSGDSNVRMLLGRWRTGFAFLCLESSSGNNGDLERFVDLSLHAKRATEKRRLALRFSLLAPTSLLHSSAFVVYKNGLMRKPDSKFVCSVLLGLILVATLIVSFSPDSPSEFLVSSKSRVPSSQDQAPSPDHAKAINPDSPQVPLRAADVVDPGAVASSHVEKMCIDFAGKAGPKLDGIEFVDALLGHALGKGIALEQWLNAVVASGTARQRGAALSLLATRSHMLSKQGGKTTQSNSAVTPGDASFSSDARHGSAVTNFANALVQDAIHRDDPNLYAMAHHLCNMYGLHAGTQCSQLSSAQWMYLDSDNGVPALVTLSEIKLSENAGVSASFDNALYRLSLAKRFDSYFDIDKHLPSPPSSVNNREFQRELEAVSFYYLMNLPIISYQNVVLACSGDALKNSNRRFVCEAIVKQYMREDASMIDYAYALKLANNLGQDPSQIQKMKDELDVIRGYQRIQNEREEREAKNQSREKRTCERSWKEFSVIRSSIAGGELKHYRQEIERSGLTKAEIIRIGLGK